MFGVDGAILRTLGMQWRMAAIFALCLWCLCLPAVLWFSTAKQAGLSVQWTLYCPSFALSLQARRS